MKQVTGLDRTHWILWVAGTVLLAGCSRTPILVAAPMAIPSGATATSTIPPLPTRIRRTATPPPTAAPPAPAETPMLTLGPTLVFPIGQHTYSATLQIAQDTDSARTVDVNYLLYLPRDYGQDPLQRWPLILFLHGAGERGYDPIDITRYSLPQFLQNGLDFPAIVLSPQSPPDNWWSSQVDVLDALLNQIQATYLVDSKRVYVTGQSMGGFGTWALALKYPARFAAVVPVASGWDYTNEFVPQNICDLKDVPIWVFHGAQDESVPPDQALAMVQALQDCGSNVRLTLYPDADHLESSNRAYADPGLYDWLLQQSLK